jgi:hypothetical protein
MVSVSSKKQEARSKEQEWKRSHQSTDALAAAFLILAA